MPDNYDEEDTTITYADLVDFEQGYADAMIGHFSNREDAARWIGINGGSLAIETLEAIRNDCRRFVINMIESSVDEHGSMELIDELHDYDAGRLFFLERMEVGVGFGDMASVEDDVRQRLIDAAQNFEPFELDIGEDRLVRVVIGPLSYRSLTELQRGFASALVGSESQSQKDKDWENFDDRDGGEPHGPWDGVTVHDFSQRAFRAIVEGCEEFVAIVGSEHAGWRDFIPDVPDYDIGWYLYFQRQRAGVGFGAVLGNSDLTDLMRNAAETLGEMTVEVGDDGQIHVRRRDPREYKPFVWFEVSKEDEELLERMRAEGFSIRLSLDPESGGVIVRKGGMSAEWLFISEIGLSDGRTMSDAKSALEALLEPAVVANHSP